MLMCLDMPLNVSPSKNVMVNLYRTTKVRRFYIIISYCVFQLFVPKSFTKILFQVKKFKG